MRVLKIIAAAGIFAAAGWLCPPAVHAVDPCIGDAPDCPIFGHLVCQEKRAGMTPDDIIETAENAYGLDKPMAAARVNEAIANCASLEGR